MTEENAVPEGWQTSSGLAIDDADITIDDVTFKYTDYNNGETLVAVFTLRADDGEEAEQWFPCGKGWEPANKGKEARHESGKAGKQFNKNSAYGKFCDSALAAGAGPTLYERGPATNAEVWAGLKFHVEAVTEKFTINGDEREATRIIATSFLGVEGDDKATKKAGTKSEKKDEAKAESNGDGGVTGPLKAKLSALAKQHDTHDAFMEAAFGVDGVMGDSAAEEAVMDTSDAGLYALARA